MFSLNYETRYGDYKNFDSVKPGTILDIVQDISVRDSASRGYGIHELRKMNMAWLLQGISVYFEAPVNTVMPIDACTAVRSIRGATSERGCILKQDGKIAAKTIANWFLFNTEKMRICKIPKEMLSVYECHEFNDDFFKYKKLTPLDIDTSEYTVKISNSHIDTNKHLNNQKGAEILMDALPFDFYYNSIDLIYKKPAYLGDKLEVCIKELPSGFYVHLQTENKEVCVAGSFELK